MKPFMRNYNYPCSFAIKKISEGFQNVQTYLETSPKELRVKEL